MRHNYQIRHFYLRRFHSHLLGLLLFALLSSNAFALEPMRPRISLQSTGAGVEVTLDFKHIPAEYWSELLRNPTRFYESGYGLAGREGEPALPQLTELIPVSSISTPNFSVLDQTSLILNSTSIKKTPPARLESDPPVSIKSWDWSTPSNGSSGIILGDPLSMLGEYYLPLTFQPLILDQSKQQVSALTELVIMVYGITLGDPSNLDDTGNIRSIIPDEDIYDKLGHYLIITPPEYEPYLQYLVDWKQRKGHPVTVVNTSEAGQTANMVRNYIQEAYDTWEDPPLYILLIGDEDQGIGGFYVYNPDMEALVTDHPYVLLDGDDSFPEAWIGRLSVDTISELATLINKILSYESQPFMDDPDWFKRALMVCTITQAISTQQTKNWVSNKLVENGFVQIDTAYYPMQSSLSHISNPINDGVGFVNYRGLGAWDHWIGPFFYNSDIDILSNGYKLPILTNIVCGGGNFASWVDPVFGEKWIRAGTVNVPKGAVAFIGPSEVHTHTQFNNVIDIALYSALFDLNINELGPALWYAKLELWRNYYQSEFLPYGQSAEFYQHVYNILGDPGLAVWTDTPHTLVVDYPESLNMSDDHVDIIVQDDSGTPVADAFVFLFNAENTVGLKTGNSGQLTLPFIPGVETELALTITGNNLLPVMVNIPIEDTEYPVSYSNWQISPENLLQAGESHSFNLNLTNNAELINELTLTLTDNSTNCTLSDSVIIIEDFDAGTTLDLEQVFGIDINPNTRHGELVEFMLELTTSSDSWIWKRSFPIQAPMLQIIDVNVVEGDLMAGDSVHVGFLVENQGGMDCPPTLWTIQEQALISASVATLNCPEITIDESQMTLDEGLLNLSDQIYPGETLELVFISAGENRQDTMEFSLTFEQLNRFTPSLPDAYGYRVYDEMDISYSLAPVYEWLEIDPNLGGPGSRLSIYDTAEEDDAKILLDAPFPISYYGETFDDFTVCSNGWMSLGSTPELSFYNRVIPSPEGPNAMIAPFWDDLLTSPGGVNYYELEDRFIIEWSRVRNLHVGSTLNFQVIIYDIESYPTASGDNLIKMQYMDFFDYDTWSNFSTIGIESPDYTTGLQVSYNNIQDISIGSMYPGRALLYTTERAQRFPPPVMSLDQASLNFVLNPFSLAMDSIAISNSGGSPLVFNISPVEDLDRLPASNPVAGIDAVKGGPEPDGSAYIQTQRELFDYEWRDQDDPDGPVFSWNNISQPENELEYTDDPDDSSIGPIDIGFDFPFYSELYSQFYFSTNGTISFLSDDHPWNNLPLPNGEAPAALIAPWWDDLNNNDGIQGIPYFYSNGVDSAIVTWENFPKFGTQDFHTFQLILVVNGDIVYQYLEMEGSRTVSTVGIQNMWKNKGLQIYYNIPNEIEEGDALRISRNASWLTIDTWSGLIEPGETGYFNASIDTRNLEPGTFSVPLLLSTNDVNTPETELGINLEVIHGVHPPGDVNGDYQVNLLDLSTHMELAVEMEIPDDNQFSRADLDQNGTLNILDTIILLEFLLQN